MQGRIPSRKLGFMDRSFAVPAGAHYEYYLDEISTELLDGASVTCFSPDPKFQAKVGSNVTITCPEGAPTFLKSVGSNVTITCKGEPIFKSGKGKNIKIQNTAENKDSSENETSSDDKNSDHQPVRRGMSR